MRPSDKKVWRGPKQNNSSKFSLLLELPAEAAHLVLIWGSWGSAADVRKQTWKILVQKAANTQYVI